jgi:hypothetical protein
MNSDESDPLKQISDLDPGKNGESKAPLSLFFFVMQVLVRVVYAGVNPVETYIREGQYSRLPDLPYIPGSGTATNTFNT